MASEQLTVILQNNGTRERNIYSIHSPVSEIVHRSPYSPKTSGNSSAYHRPPGNYNTNEQAIRTIQHGGNFVLSQTDSTSFP